MGSPPFISSPSSAATSASRLQHRRCLRARWDVGEMAQIRSPARRSIDLMYRRCVVVSVSAHRTERQDRWPCFLCGTAVFEPSAIIGA
jgi:hypothetical protein